jgi:hypothetical protein
MRILLLLALLWLMSACASSGPVESLDLGATLSDTIAIDPEAFAPGSAVQYPANYRDEFEQYITVDRKDAVVRHIFVSPQALESLRQTRRIPDGTIIVIEAYSAQVDENGDPLRDDQGHFLPGEVLDMVHVAQKRADWQAADFPSAARAGQWNFGSFEFGSGAPFDEDLNACFNCHQATPNSDFLYTGQLLAQYAFGGDPLYMYCELSRRTPCT